MPKKTDANNGVKSKKLIKLSKDIWELGKGWVYTTQLSAKSAEQEFDELFVGFKDINGDDYMVRMNEKYATISISFIIDNPDGTKEVLVEDMDGMYSTISIIKYIKNLPKTFIGSIKEY